MSRLDLRLIVITDRALAAPRTIHDVIRECLEAGAPAIQLRDKRASAADLLHDALALRSLTQQFDARLFINDRLDVALAAAADGVHLGPEDIPVGAARRAVPPGFLIGCSTDDPRLARAHASEGAAYIGCGAVFGTTSKPEVGAERIGIDGLRAVVDAVPVPVIAIGGITPQNVGAVAASGAAGCAVISAIMTAERPGEIVRLLLAAFA